jgi:hypothetical protein
MSDSRTAGQMERFSRFLLEGARLSVDAVGPLLTAFARGDSFALPPVSYVHDDEDGLEWLMERALLIAQYGLLASDEERRSAESLKNARLVAERRVAFGMAAWGVEAKADDLAADLSIPIPVAVGRLAEARAQAYANSGVSSIADRAREQIEFGPAPDPTGKKSKSNGASSMRAAVSRALGSNE